MKKSNYLITITFIENELNLCFFYIEEEFKDKYIIKKPDFFATDENRIFEALINNNLVVDKSINKKDLDQLKNNIFVTRNSNKADKILENLYLKQNFEYLNLIAEKNKRYDTLLGRLFGTNIY